MQQPPERELRGVNREIQMMTALTNVTDVTDVTDDVNSRRF